MYYDDESKTRKATEDLLRVAKDNKLLGYGSLPPLEMNLAAARSLATYMPHREARQALTHLTNQNHAPEAIRLVAAEGLARR
jgi:hypothetical protein